MENTIAEKDLEKGKFAVYSTGIDGVSFSYSSGNDMNFFIMYVGDENENVGISLKVNGKEVIMNGLPREKFIMKMREFLAKIK
jgi:hypothetical protein